MNNEKLQRYSLVAEILGGLAVILSIIYLAVEIQSNTNAIQTQSNQGLIELLNEIIYMRFENADLMLEGDGNFEELDESERYQYTQLFSASMNIYEQAFNAYSSGTLSNELWQAYSGDGQRRRICMESSQRIWVQLVDGFGPDFQLHIDAVIMGCPE